MSDYHANSYIFSSAEAYQPAKTSPSEAGTSTPPSTFYDEHHRDASSSHARHATHRRPSELSSPFTQADDSRDFEIREEVLNARLRAKASSNRASLDLLGETNAGSRRFSMAGDSAYGMPPYVDETHRPTFQPYKQSPLTRKSLLDPSAFGFDAQNGDPRTIMGEKGIDMPSSSKQTSTGNAFREANDDAQSHIELITVPALGTEYTNAELKAMKREQKRKNTVQTRRQLFMEHFRSDELVCSCFSARMLVYSAFFGLIGLAVLLYFVIPRIPMFAVHSGTPLIAVPNGASMLTHHAPTSFTMDMNVQLRADNSDSWVPSKASKMTLDVTDLSTLRVVGKGTMDDYTFPARKKTLFMFPVHFNYYSVNVTGDQTWAHWVNACGPRYDHTPRQSLNLQFTIKMHIVGRIGATGTSTQLSNLECPFTLQPEYIDVLRHKQLDNDQSADMVHSPPLFLVQTNVSTNSMQTDIPDRH